MAAGFVLLRLATNATISCKILVKISPVVSAENILMEIALRFHVMVRRISSNISRFTRPIFATYSPYEHALCADVGSTIFSNLSWDVAMATKKYCCNEGKLILHAFFARSPDGSWFSFCYYLLLMPLYLSLIHI